MKIYVRRTFTRTLETEIEVPDEDVEAGLDFDDIIEKTDDEFDYGEDETETSQVIADENGNELYYRD